MSGTPQEPDWKFWDWVGYACILVTAIILAADTAIKQNPTLAGATARVTGTVVWGFAPLVLLSVAGALAIWKHWPRRSQQMAGAAIIAPPGLPRLKALSPEIRQRAQIALRKKAEDLARELYAFVAAQRRREPDLGERFAQMSSSLASTVPFDPLPHALREYAVQYKERVTAIYVELGGGSKLAGMSITGLSGLLHQLSGASSDPTTFNEIIAVALELELNASKLPKE